MDNIQKKIVKKIKENDNSIYDKNILRELLMDAIPENKLQQNILLFAYEEGITDKLLGDDFAVSIRNIIILLKNNYGISEENAEWSVDTWLHILGLNGYSEYYYVNLNNKKAKIIPEPRQGYLNLVARIFGYQQLLTYSSLVNNYDNYLFSKIDMALETLSEKEQSIIRQRFGLDDGIKKTTEEIAANLVITEDRVLQIEAHALRKFRHPSRSRGIKFCLYNRDDQSMLKERPVDYGCLFEKILINELNYYNNTEYVNKKELLFGELISIKPFEKGKKLVSNLPIELLGLSIRSFNCLKRAGKETVGQLLEMSPDDFLNIRNLGKKGTEEVLAIIKEFNDPENNSISINDICPQGDDILITRTCLDPNTMLYLMQEEGILYLSDFFFALKMVESNNKYEFDNFGIIEYSDNSNETDTVRKFSEQYLKYLKIFELLCHHSDPMLRIKIPAKVKTVIDKLKINSLEELENKINLIPEDIKADIDTILLEIKKANEEMVAEDDYYKQ